MNVSHLLKGQNYRNRITSDDDDLLMHACINLMRLSILNGRQAIKVMRHAKLNNVMAISKNYNIFDNDWLLVKSVDRLAFNIIFREDCSLKHVQSMFKRSSWGRIQSIFFLPKIKWSYFTPTSRAPFSAAILNICHRLPLYCLFSMNTLMHYDGMRRKTLPSDSLS